jgi:hypothetical protein
VTGDAALPPPEEASLAIVGVVRDGAQSLLGSIEALENAARGFRRASFHIVESDSVDATAEVLRELAARKALAWSSAGTLRIHMKSRTERIAFCRNLLRATIERHEPDCDYVLVADLDGVNDTVTVSGLESCWQVREPWDVLTANQDGPYYDIWALRHPVWSPGDCWRDFAQLQPLFGDGPARNMAVYARQAVLPSGVPPVEVESAFGGLALYRREAFLAGTYRGIEEDGTEVCEHVGFHRDLRTKGYRIFINPRLLNSSPREHTVPPSRWARLRCAARAGLQGL